MECLPTTFIKLGRLRFGHEHPSGAVNIRIPTRENSGHLVPLIRRDGLLQGLCVVPDPDHGGEGPFFVMVGGRRLMALGMIRDDHHELDDDSPISVTICNDIDQAEALARSLAAEDAHLPPHPVDRYEAFAALKEKGFTDPTIAERFMCELRLVRQSLALGALAPEIRAAWRAGEITGEIAQNFTLADGAEHQIKALAKLRKKPGGLEKLHGATVRKLFTGSEAEANRLLKFVGRNEYVAAGGALTEDLFTSSIVVHDFAKLKKLAEEKLEIEARRLTAGEGWSWAEPQLKTSYMGYGSRLQAKAEFMPEETKRLAAIKKRLAEINKVDGDNLDDAANATLAEEEDNLREEGIAIEHNAEARSFKPAQKAKSGCIVEITHDGKLEIRAGIVKPKEEPKPAGDLSNPSRSSKPTEAPLAWESRRALAGWRNAAAGEALARNDKLAIAVFLASVDMDGGPMSFNWNGSSDDLQITKANSFAASLAGLMKQPIEKLYDLMVRVICSAVDLGAGAFEDDTESDNSFLLNALDQTVLAKAMTRNFDAKTYFKGASKPYLLELVAEVLGPDEKRRNAEKSATDLAKFAVDSVAALGWLPPELRTASYVAPAPKAGPKKTEAPEPAKLVKLPKPAKTKAKATKPAKTKLAAAAKKPTPAKKGATKRKAA